MAEVEAKMVLPSTLTRDDISQKSLGAGADDAAAASERCPHVMCSERSTVVKAGCVARSRPMPVAIEPEALQPELAQTRAESPRLAPLANRPPAGEARRRRSGSHSRSCAMR